MYFNILNQYLVLVLKEDAKYRNQIFLYIFLRKKDVDTNDIDCYTIERCEFGY